MASKDMFQLCYHRTRHVSVHWKELGVLLNMEKYRLDEIDRDNPTNVVSCRMDMLSAWLRSNPTDPAAELDAALDDLQRKVHMAIEHHENKVTLDYQIQTRIGKLKSNFGDIVVQALRWLRERYPEAQEAAIWLNEMLRGHSTSSEPLVAEDSVRNHDALRKLLQAKWSFTNSRFLQGLVQCTGDEALIERMNNYNEEFKHVRFSIPISNQEVTFEDYDPNKPCLILIFESITYFNDIEIFLDEVFHIYRRYLRVHKIKPGCIEVTLQFSANMEPFIQACIDKKCESVKHYAKKMHIVSKTDECIEEESRASTYGGRRSSRT